MRPDSTVISPRELKGKLVGITQSGSAGDTFLRAALKKIGIKDSEVISCRWAGRPEWPRL